MQTVLRWVAVVGILVGSMGAASARDIHVNNMAGNDRYLGMQEQPQSDGNGPVKSIAKALRIAISGDRIVIANTGQPYRESLTLFGSDHSGTVSRPFTILGNGATLEGADEIDIDRWQHVRDDVFRFQPRHLTYLQLFLNAKPAVRILCSHPCTTPPELQPLEWCLHRGHLYFRSEPLKRPEDYALTVATRQVGITLFHVEHVALLNLTIQGFQLDAVNAHNSARDVVLQQVTCRGNGRAGVAVGGASLVSIDSSIIGNNGEAQLLTRPYSKTFVRQSDLLSNTAPAWLDRGGTVILDGNEVEGGIDERGPTQDEVPAET